MNTPSLISPHKCSNDNKSVINSPSRRTSKSNKRQKTSNSSSFKTNEEIFPDFGINWDSRNRMGFSKKEMNFGTSLKKENMNESVDIIDNNNNNWKSETLTLSEFEEDSKEKDVEEGTVFIKDEDFTKYV